MSTVNLLKKWWDVGTINPTRDAARMPTLLLWCERLSIVVVAIVSGVAVAAYGYKLASGYVESVIIRYAFAAIFFALATAITDVGVKYFIQSSAYDFFATLNPATYKGSTYTWFQRAMQVVEWLAKTGIIAGLFYFDYISVESVRRPVANMVKQEKQINQDSIRERVIAQEKARVLVTANAITAAQQALRRLEKDIADTESRVERSDPELVKLVTKGNTWAPKRLRAKKDAATASLRKQVEREQENIAFLREQQSLTIADGRGVVSRSDSATLATNAAISARNLDLVQGTSTMFIWMGFWAKCIAGLIRILLVAMFMGGTIKD
jgi:hypothetical protein